MTGRHVQLMVSELTTRQVLVYLLELNLDIKSRLTKVEKTVSSLSDAVASLQTAVDNVATRQNAHITDLQNKLADALAQVQALTANDAADEAALTAAKQQISDLLAEASSAADSIKSQVDELNGLGADPSTPVGDGGSGAGDTPAPSTGGDTPADGSGAGDTPAPSTGGDVTPPGDTTGGDAPATGGDAPTDSGAGTDAPATGGDVPADGGNTGGSDAPAGSDPVTPVVNGGDANTAGDSTNS